jgi:Tol biopolymer transport system component
MPKFPTFTVLTLTAAACVTAGGTGPDTGRYLGLEPPGMKPEVFAPAWVSTVEHEFAPAFSPDGEEFYFSRGVGPYRRKSIMVTRIENGEWTRPVRALPFEEENFEARLTPDGKKMFFMGFNRDPDKERPEIDMFFANRNKLGWGDATRLGSPFNPGGSMYISFTEDGTIYTTDTGAGNIVRSRLEEGRYQEFEPLPHPVNTDDAQQAYPFVAPDQSYIIFNEIGGNRGGESGLLVSFRHEDGSWTVPREIPLKMTAGTASVSPDGRYLFFTAKRPKGDIYWVDARIFKNLHPMEK